MKVTKTPEGNVRLEFDSQHEIDGLWVLAGHVGGAHYTLRSLVSGLGHGEEGLFEKLEPYVSPMLTRVSRRVAGAPREITDIISGKYHQRVEGSIFFKPLASPVYDDAEEMDMPVSSSISYLPDQKELSR